MISRERLKGSSSSSPVVYTTGGKFITEQETVNGRTVYACYSGVGIKSAPKGQGLYMDTLLGVFTTLKEAIDRLAWED